jgi:parallel beta-helix repeat protein
MGLYHEHDSDYRPADIQINSCRFRYIDEYGIYLGKPSANAMHIYGSYFKNCNLVGIAISKDSYSDDDACVIYADTIIGSISGIVFGGNSNSSYTKKPSISYCVIYGTGIEKGTGLTIATSESQLPLFSPTIVGDSIVNFQKGINLINVNSNCTLMGNKVKSNGDYGIYLQSASPRLISTLTMIPNVFNSSKVGMYGDKFSNPYVRYSKLKENTKIGAYFGDPSTEVPGAPDFGTAADSGFNSIYATNPSPSYLDMQSYRSSLLSAIGNWWGEDPPNESQIDGNIDYSNHLASDPLPGYAKPNPDIPHMPTEMYLAQNYPNPFNSNTEISFYLQEPGFAELKIYNLRGQLVKILISEFLQTGKHMIVWSGQNTEGNEVSSGIYFYSLNSQNERYTKIMTLIR